MKKDWVLTQEALDGLLDWLDHDREQAAFKYETIRARLIKILVGRGCYEAEELADEIINRVTIKAVELAHYEGHKALYFYAVANNVYREWLRRPATTEYEPGMLIDESASVTTDDQKKFDCLERCLDELTPDSRTLFLEYHQKEKGSKIGHRLALARQYGIAINALRIRVHRIRAQLKRCLADCLEGVPAH